MTHCENNALGKERLPEKLASVANLHARSLSVSSFYAPADRDRQTKGSDARDGLLSAPPPPHLADTRVPLDARTPPAGQLAAPASPSTPLVTDTAREADEGGGGMVSHSHAAPPVRCGLVNLKFGDAAGATAE